MKIAKLSLIVFVAALSVCSFLTSSQAEVAAQDATSSKVAKTHKKSKKMFKQINKIKKEEPKSDKIESTK